MRPEDKARVIYLEPEKFRIVKRAAPYGARRHDLVFDVETYDKDALGDPAWRQAQTISKPFEDNDFYPQVSESDQLLHFILCAVADGRLHTLGGNLVPTSAMPRPTPVMGCRPIVPEPAPEPTPESVELTDDEINF